jgi:hypothetical protein
METQKIVAVYKQAVDNYQQDTGVDLIKTYTHDGNKYVRKLIKEFQLFHEIPIFPWEYHDSVMPWLTGDISVDKLILDPETPLVEWI